MKFYNIFSSFILLLKVSSYSKSEFSCLFKSGELLKDRINYSRLKIKLNII